MNSRTLSSHPLVKFQGIIATWHLTHLLWMCGRSFYKLRSCVLRSVHLYKQPIFKGTTEFRASVRFRKPPGLYNTTCTLCVNASWWQDKEYQTPGWDKHFRVRQSRSSFRNAVTAVWLLEVTEIGRDRTFQWCGMVTGRGRGAATWAGARACILEEQTEVVWGVQELPQLVLLSRWTLNTLA